MGPEISPPDKRNLRVLLNAAPLSGVLTGIARYTRALYGAILDFGLAEVSFFVNGRITKGMPNQSKGAISRYFPAMVRNIVRESKLVLVEYRLNRQCRNYTADVYHETSMFPVSRGLPIRTVLTIYDLSLL